jgi:hypothetical protein
VVTVAPAAPRECRLVCSGGDIGSAQAGNDGGAGWRDLSPHALGRPAVNPSDPPSSAVLDAASAQPARRRATLAALFGLVAVGGPAMAQMGGGGGGHGMRGQQQDGPRPDKDAKDAHGHADAPPRDLVSAYATRLHEDMPELALAPAQQRAFRDFVASLAEVGQHNERRMQRILWRSASAVSAVAPLKTYIAAEVDEGEGRQEALAELKVAYDKLDAQLDERQRGVLASLFVATRSELQASRER